MVNENEPNELTVTPESPSIVPKAGWTTSQGQMTAIFILVCLILSYFGIQKTPEQLGSYLDVVNNLIETVMPIILGLVGLVKYTTSRGKIQSNAIMANAQVMAAKEVAKPLAVPASLMDDRFTKVIGGDSWKDPERYTNLLKIAEAVGVPGVEPAVRANDKFHIDYLISGILNGLKKKKEQ